METARNPHETSLQTKIGALQDLQMILQGNQDLPQEQLVLVKNQVTELAMTIRAAPAPVVTGPPPPPPPPAVAMAASRHHTATPPVISPPVAHHSPFPPPPVHHMPPHVVAPPLSGTPPPAPPKVSLSSLFGPGAMAAIMKAKGEPNAVKSQTPPPPAHMAIRPPRPQGQAPKSQVDPAALIAMLRSKGIIGSKPAAVLAAPRDPKNLEEAVIGLEFKSSSLKQ